MDSRDGLPRGVLPSGILKMEKYCPGLKVRSPVLPIMEIADIIRLLLWYIYCVDRNEKFSS